MSLTPAGDVAGTAAGFTVSLSTDKPNYRPGEPIVITLEVTNHTAEEVPLRFTSAQRFDFIIRDAKGGQAWLWSDSQAFASVIGIETLGPKRPRLSYQAEFRETLAPGLYSVEGRLTAKNRPLVATLLIEVR